MNYCELQSCSFFAYQAAFQNNTPPLWVANYFVEAYFLIEVICCIEVYVFLCHSIRDLN